MSRSTASLLQFIRSTTWLAGSALLPLLGLAGVVATIPWLSAERGEMGIIFPWLVFVVGGLACGLALLPTHAYAVLMGWCFGFSLGFPLAWMGITLAGLLGYLMGRLLLRNDLHQMIQTRPRWQAVHVALLEVNPARTLILVTLLRLSPIVPFATLNLLLAAGRLSVRPYLAGTILGMGPFLVGFALIGAGLNELTFDHAKDPWLVWLGIGATLMALWLVGFTSFKVLRSMLAESKDLPLKQEDA